MNEKRILRLSIFDKSYAVSTDENEEHIYAAAKLVDSLLRDITAQVKTNNESKIAVLAALKFATDFVKSEELQKNSESKVGNILEILQSSDAA